MFNRKDFKFEIGGMEFSIPDLTLDIEFELDEIYAKFQEIIDYDKVNFDNLEDAGTEMMSQIMTKTPKELKKEIGLFGIKEIKGLEDAGILESFTWMYALITDFVHRRLELKKK